MRRRTATWILSGLAALGALLVLPIEPALVGAIRSAARVEPAPRPVQLVPEIGVDVDEPPRVVVSYPRLFEPVLPEAPPRYPHWAPPSRLRTPVGGRVLVEAQRAIREHRCADALHAVQQGIHEVSPDYVALVGPAWLCFDYAYTRRLARMQVDDPRGMAVVHALLGSPRWNGPADPGPVPFWYRQAEDGVEFRLERLSADDVLRRELVAVFGEQNLADQMARDLHLEAMAAVAQSRIAPADRNLQDVEQWARRVFMVEWALGQVPGDLLRAHRRELVPELERLLDLATAARGVGGERLEVPETVLRARRAGRGQP